MESAAVVAAWRRVEPLSVSFSSSVRVSPVCVCVCAITEKNETNSERERERGRAERYVKQLREHLVATNFNERRKPACAYLALRTKV